ncbi:MAG TPA: MBL fold metallo-hydrolase [Burkholderiales bacterium]|nr:MBL fold metallo-hydrolase [Burkholderiales bacterium]
MRIALARVLLTGILSLAAAGGTALAQDEAQRSVTHITGDLYRFQNQFHFSVFLVTKDGIIATDPINADAARWLKQVLATRYPGKPVRYLIYSHSHDDHVSGGEVFADSATVVAHEDARARIVAEKVPTAVPDITYTDRMTIRYGGKTVELYHFGPSHTNNLTIMRFPEESTVFVVDIVAPRRLPYQYLTDSDIDGWIDTLRAIEALDFDILAPGHSTIGSKLDIVEQRAYLELLRARVQAAIKAGTPLPEIKRTVTMDEFSGWSAYNDWREMNIEGMHRYLMRKN